MRQVYPPDPLNPSTQRDRCANRQDMGGSQKIIGFLHVRRIHIRKSKFAGRRYCRVVDFLAKEKRMYPCVILHLLAHIPHTAEHPIFHTNSATSTTPPFLTILRNSQHPSYFTHRFFSSPKPSANMSSPDNSNPPLSEIFRKAGKRALGGGIPGAVAMGAQVVTLMPLRSTMNYQYRYGNSTTSTAIRTLYADGGIRRFYRGIGPALFQGPLSRFGDTAANSGMLTLLDSFDNTKNLPVGVKTAAASGTAAAWRIFLMRMYILL